MDGLSWWNMRRKAVAQVKKEIENETASCNHLANTFSRNDITVPILFPREPDATSPLGSDGSVHTSCVSVQATTDASTNRFDVLSCGLEDASELHHLEKSYNSCSKSIESENAESCGNFYSTYCDFDYQNVFNSSSDEEEPQSLRNRLSEWAVTSNVTNSSLGKLLKVLRIEHPNLPKDPRSIRGIHKNVELTSVAGGQYYHFGLKNGITLKLSLLAQLQPEELEQLSTVELQFNIDGLPLYRSSPGEFWPILCMISNVSVKLPFPIGIYFGVQKPTNCKDYLTPFLAEVKDILREGITYCDKMYAVKLLCFICDAPARAFVKSIIQHTGYSSCERCTSKGVWARKVVHPDLSAPLRSNETFRSMEDAHHHKGLSPLLELKLDMVYAFPLEYMHSCCLGVMRRLLFLWFRSREACRIPGSIYSSICTHLASLSVYTPREFARKPRSLKYLERWKASELRQFLLYTGPVVLKDKIDKDHYKHFLMFSVAMHILLSPDFSVTTAMVEYAGKLLHLFVEYCGKLYGTEMLVYNVHCLIHIHEDALRFGALDKVSAFPFENFLGQVKKLLKKPNQPLQQVVNKLLDQSVAEPTLHEQTPSTKCKKRHLLGPLPTSLRLGEQYMNANSPVGFISIDDGDNFVQLDDFIVQIKNIVVFRGTTYVVCSKFETADNFFSYPVKSSKVGIVVLSDLCAELLVVPIHEIKSKLVVYPHPSSNKYVAMCLLHTLS